MLMSERAVVSVSQGAWVSRSLDRQKLVFVILFVSASNVPSNRALGSGAGEKITVNADVDIAHLDLPICAWIPLLTQQTDLISSALAV